MTLSMTKGLAFCGLCALLAGAGSAASAQSNYAHHDYAHHGYTHHAIHHGPATVRHPRRAILRQKAAYARDVAHGRYGAAERAHLRAKAIRQRVRAHREMHRDHRF